LEFAKFKLKTFSMGAQTSSVLDQLPPDFPPKTRFVGLKNFGNTCFINAVLQALYACKLFRDLVLNFHHHDPPSGNKLPRAGSPETSLLQSLSCLFRDIESLKKQTGMLSPDHFVQQVRSENELFRVPQHHDAQ
jgi:ubiquitin C-terminal hydrolase